MNWFIYIVRCADDTLYTGIAMDVKRRLAEHNGDDGHKAGAKYTRSRQPVSLVYSETAESRSIAASREFAIKKLSRAQKEILISSTM